MSLSNLSKGALAGVVLVTASWADAALIRITPPNVAPDEQSETSPVPLADGDFRLTYHSEGSGEIFNPLTLIVGMPSGDEPTLIPGAGHNTSAFVDAGQPQDHGWWSGSPNSVYGFVGGLDPIGAGNSQNYSNWVGSVDELGLEIDAWRIFTFDIFFEPQLNPSFWHEFSLSGVPIPAGTYIAGWGCTSLNRFDDCSSSEATPFTFAGLVTAQVPTPGTMMLLGGGLLGLGLTRRRRKTGAAL